MENIYLVGFMGTGKSSVASALMKFLPCRVVEMDSAIEALACMPISKIFETLGEDSFRTMESQLLKEISKEKNQIVSCGGGIILKQENIDMMKSSGTVIRLNASPETIYKRTVGKSHRPLLKEKTLDDVKAMIASREEYYLNAADYTIDCDSLTVEAVAGEIVKTLALNGKLD